MATLSGYFTRMWKRIFQKIYRFDKWHISSIDQRKYAQDIIRHVNNRKKRDFFSEIGCGLGDIIRNVHFDVRLGFDIDEHVLRAVRVVSHLLGQKNIKYTVFSFPDSDLPGVHDVILMVNWIHHIEPSVLKSNISRYFEQKLQQGGEIIIDTVQDPEYRFNHDILFLTKDLNCSISMLGRYERQRQVWSIKKSNG